MRRCERTREARSRSGREARRSTALSARWLLLRVVRLRAHQSGGRDSCQTEPHVRAFGASSATNFKLSAIHDERSWSDSKPAEDTYTKPRIGLPVKSISRAYGLCSACSYWSDPT